MFHILAAKLHNSAEITKFSHLKKHKKFHKRLFAPPHALFYSLFPRFSPCRDASRHRAAPHPARRLAFPITPPRDSYFPLKKNWPRRVCYLKLFSYFCTVFLLIILSSLSLSPLHTDGLPPTSPRGRSASPQGLFFSVTPRPHPDIFRTGAPMRTR